MRKRFISLMLIVGMMLCMLPMPAFAQTEDVSAWETTKNAFASAETQDIIEDVDYQALLNAVDSKTRSTGLWESEPNNTMSTANRIYNDYIVDGSVSSSDLLDYFKFVLPSQSDVTIACLSTKSTLMIGIINTSGDAVAAAARLGYSDGYYQHALIETLEAGTYYVVPLDVNKDDNSYAFSIAWETHSHSCTSVVTEPTCTAAGYTTYTCPCGYSYTSDSVAATGHNYGDWTQTAAPTCTEAGTERRDCANCDAYETRDVDATGHDYAAVVTAPTCTEGGYTTYTCPCGDSYTGNETAATGHSYGAWTQTKAPTVTTEGEERRDCANCDAYETRTVASLSLSAPVVKISGNTTTGKPKLSWSAVSGADFYRIYRAVGSTGKYSYLKSTRSTSFTDTSAEAGTNYYYKIRAVVEETDETSGWSNIVNRCCDLEKPVVTLKVDTASGKPKITFEKISGAEKYYIVRSTSKTGTYSKLATITGTSYIDTSAEAGTNYYYKVKALHEKDAADSAYSDVVNRVCDLAKPTVSMSVNTTTGKPVVKWETVEGAAKYRVYRSTTKDSGYELVYTAVTARTYTDNTAEAGTNYYYKVKAVHTNSAADSAYSEIVNRVCDLAKPVVSITLSGGNPKFSWDTVEGAEKYEIWRATSKSGEYKKVKTAITARSYTDTSVTAGKTYYYKVMAIHSNSAANSAYSSIVSIAAK